MSDWLDKAKQAAKEAAESAKSFAQKAKDADYGEMLNKTKQMAKDAVEETKRAADSFKSKDTTEQAKQADPVVTVETTTETKVEAAKVQPNLAECVKQIDQIQAILDDLKKKLQ